MSIAEHKQKRGAFNAPLFWLTDVFYEQDAQSTYKQ
jgi:hypothetical protein